MKMLSRWKTCRLTNKAPPTVELRPHMLQIHTKGKLRSNLWGSYLEIFLSHYIDKVNTEKWYKNTLGFGIVQVSLWKSHLPTTLYFLNVFKVLEQKVPLMLEQQYLVNADNCWKYWKNLLWKRIKLVVLFWFFKITFIIKGIITFLCWWTLFNSSRQSINKKGSWHYWLY